MALPAAYEKLLQAFDALPGIGPRAAERLVQFVLAQPQGEVLAQAITRARHELTQCGNCFRYALSSPCEVCSGSSSGSTLYVVENTRTQLAAEEQGITQLFVLHGLLSPVAGVGPSQLHLSQLRERILRDGINNIVLELSDSVEARVTAQYIEDLLADTDVVISQGKQEPDHGAA